MKTYTAYKLSESDGLVRFNLYSPKSDTANIIIEKGIVKIWEHRPIGGWNFYDVDDVIIKQLN